MEGGRQSRCVTLSLEPLFLLARHLLLHTQQGHFVVSAAGIGVELAERAKECVILGRGCLMWMMETVIVFGA